MQASLPNGLMPAHSRDICLGHPNLILAQPSQVFPLLELLVSREDLPTTIFLVPLLPQDPSPADASSLVPELQLAGSAGWSWRGDTRGIVLHFC